jgi:hypothetical protein
VAATHVAEPPPAPAATAAAPVAQVAPAQIGEVEPSTQLDALPLADKRLKDDALAFRVGKSGAASKELVLEKKSAAPASAPVKAPVAAKSRDLKEEMAQAVGGGAPPKSAAKPEPQVAQEPLPDRPTIGDAQAAAGPALMKARMCLAGQETGSQAKLTFGSDGRVKNVVISGPAAGTPAEGCLKAQLSSARVPPFSEKSFSFSLTVRPP